MFLRNSWYVAAWANEIGRMAMLRRILLGDPVVLYRRTDGKPVALKDRCCHRHAPLSSGRVRGDFRMTHGAFLEDLKMIAGQQANIDLDPSVPRVNIATDTGGMQARRAVEALIAAEQAGKPKRITPLALTP